MPIHEELIYNYDEELKPAYLAVSRQVLLRAGGRCEKCASPQGRFIKQYHGTLSPGRPGEDNPELMFWVLTQCGRQRWINHRGAEVDFIPDLFHDRKLAKKINILEKLTLAHDNQQQADNSPSNVLLLCRWHAKVEDPLMRDGISEWTRHSQESAQELLVARIRERRKAEAYKEAY